MSDQPIDKPTTNPTDNSTTNPTPTPAPTAKPEPKKPRANYDQSDGHPANAEEIGKRTDLLINPHKEVADDRGALLELLSKGALADHLKGITVDKKRIYADIHIEVATESVEQDYRAIAGELGRVYVKSSKEEAGKELAPTSRGLMKAFAEFNKVETRSWNDKPGVTHHAEMNEVLKRIIEVIETSLELNTADMAIALRVARRTVENWLEKGVYSPSKHANIAAVQLQILAGTIMEAAY